jgi:hypothetical protein
MENKLVVSRGCTFYAFGRNMQFSRETYIPAKQLLLLLPALVIAGGFVVDVSHAYSFFPAVLRPHSTHGGSKYFYHSDNNDGAIVGCKPC